MKKITKHLGLLLVSMLLTGFACMAQSTAMNTVTKHSKTSKPEMNTYVIERNIPGAGKFTPEKLKEISKTSNKVLKEMGPGIQWLHSYVTGDKIFCVYKAENIELLKEHAQKGGFPITAIYEVSSIISPATAK
jgi:Nickel responsive protein SCO4226-like